MATLPRPSAFNTSFVPTMIAEREDAMHREGALYLRGEDGRWAEYAAVLQHDTLSVGSSGAGVAAPALNLLHANVTMQEASDAGRPTWYIIGIQTAAAGSVEYVLGVASELEARLWAAALLIAAAEPYEGDVTTDTLWSAVNNISSSADVAKVRSLLKGAAQLAVDARDEHGGSLLHKLSAGKYSLAAAAVAGLVAAGLSVDGTDRGGGTALVEAARRGEDHVVRALLELGADVSAVDADKCTALHVASEAGHLTVVDELLNWGVAVDAVTDIGYTALHAATWNGLIEVVRRLLDAGAHASAATTDVGFTPLHVAAIAGWDVVVRTLLAAGVAVDATTVAGYTALHLASQQHNPTIAALLLRAGADPNASSPNLHTPLHMLFAPDRSNPSSKNAAIHTSRRDVVALLLAAGADVHAELTDGYSPIMRAAATNGAADCIELLVAAGADLDAPGGGGEAFNPLRAASAAGNTSAVSKLLELGADPLDATVVGSSRGLTALHCAAGSGHVAATALLLAAGADVSAGVYLDSLQPAVHLERGRSALQLACLGGHALVVELLLAAGAVDPENMSLHHACRGGYVDVARALLNAGLPLPQGFELWFLLQTVRDGRHFGMLGFFFDLGVDPSIAKDSVTLLHEASCSGDIAVVDCLLRHGARVSDGDGAGMTPLNWACAGGHVSVVVALLAAGAAVDCIADDGRTPLRSACSAGNSRIVELLLGAGANPNLVTREAGTALHAACNSNHSDVVRILLDAGVNPNSTRWRAPPLYHAMRRGYSGVVAAMVAGGADMLTVGSAYDEEVTAALRGPDFSTLNMLVGNGMVLEGSTRWDGSTRLHEACGPGRAGTVRALLAVGCAADAADQRGRTALDTAVRGGRTECVQLLLGSEEFGPL